MSSYKQLHRAAVGWFIIDGCVDYGCTDVSWVCRIPNNNYTEPPKYYTTTYAAPAYYTTKAPEYYTTKYAAPAYYTEAPKYYTTTYAAPAYYNTNVYYLLLDAQMNKLLFTW